MKKIKHVNNLVKIIKQNKNSENINEKVNKINWNTPKEQRIPKNSWKINIQKCK